jgi:hypothetical protein
MHVATSHKSHRLLTTVPHPPSVVPRLPSSAPKAAQPTAANQTPIVSPTRPVVAVATPSQIASIAPPLNTTAVARSGTAANRVSQTQAVVAPSYATHNTTKTGGAVAYATSFRKSQTGLVRSYVS